MGSNNECRYPYIPRCHPGAGIADFTYTIVFAMRAPARVSLSCCIPIEADSEKSYAMDEEIKVLIAQNGGNAHQNLQEMLAEWPMVHVVGEASDGEDALRLVERQQPHVVVMTAELPVLDGIQTTLIIKALWPSTRVILVADQAGYRGLAREAGADAFLSESFSGDDVVQAMIQ